MCALRRKRDKGIPNQGSHLLNIRVHRTSYQREEVGIMSR
jgi:hypothetical protein